MRRTQRPRNTRNTRESRDSRDSRPDTRFGQSRGPSARILLSGGMDINTNLGEGFGHYRVEGESDILPFVTSANIACGAHAGDPSIMEAALEEARYYGLALGAHIGYPDLAGFGRREIHLPAAELRASILYQLGALSGLARTFGFEISQVRPHGFMYRQMFHDVRTATTVARAIAEFDRWIVLIGPAGHNLLAAGEKAGIRVAGEVWVDRGYDSHGNLLPHSHPRAIIHEPQDIIKQASTLIRNRTLMAVDGSIVRIDFQSIHLHPAIPKAKMVAEQIRSLMPNASPLSAEPYNPEDDEHSRLSWAEI